LRSDHSPVDPFLPAQLAAACAITISPDTSPSLDITMHTQEDRLADLLVRWEEAQSSKRPPEVETFCQANGCTDLVSEFRDLIARIDPLRLDGPPIGNDVDDAWSPGGRFSIKNVLGRGGLGVVYLADDTELDRAVAVKRMRRPAATNPESRTRFVREARLTGRLDHPGVVPVHTLATGQDGEPYYAMRRISGQSLREAIERFHQSASHDPGERNFALRRLLRGFVTACETVAYAHSQGVIHRDLKPHNVMLGAFGETLVIDWGLARDLHGRISSEDLAGKSSEVGGIGSAEETQLVANLPIVTRNSAIDTPSAEGTVEGIAMGSWGYMGPEQARGEWQRVGPASDIFSLGATLYHILAGQPPYPGGHGPEPVREAQFLPPTQVKSDVPKPLEAICLKAMAKSPSDRYADARDLARDVECWLADEPVAAFPDPFSVRARRWAKRHRTLVAAGLALLGTATVALAGGLFLVERERERTELARRDTKLALDETAAAKGRTERALVATASAQHRTREALNATTDHAVERLMAGEKRLMPADRAFLQTVLGYYQSFAKEVGDDIDSQGGVADAYFRAGVIQARLGDRAAAETAYREAGQRYQRISDATKGEESATFRMERAQTLHNLSLVLRDRGNRTESESLALEIERDLPDLIPSLAPSIAIRARRLQALVANSLGGLHNAAGRREAALAAYQKAVEIHRGLMADEPGRAEHADELARSLANLASELMIAGKYDEAQTAIEEGLEIHRALTRDDPNEPAYVAGQGHALVTLGNLTMARLKIPQALALFRQAATLLRPLVRQYPGDTEYRANLAEAMRNLGYMQRQFGDKIEAEQCLREAVELYDRLLEDAPDFAELKANRGIAAAGLGDMLKTKNATEAAKYYDAAGADLLSARDGGAAGKISPILPRMVFWNRADLADKAGDHAALAKAARRLREVAPSVQQDGVNAAAFLAKAMVLLEKDTASTPERRKDLRDEYGAAAVEALQAAVNAGFKDSARLRRDDFAPIAGREDFKKLIAELERKK
jgi:eukaryotic-like serine/threonine-protein kinase